MFKLPSDHEIQQAVNFLRQGKLVAFPTETVYGLGANAMDISAVKQIFKVKGRPSNHPVIVHLGDLAQLEQWTSHIPELAWQLAERFWPGPLTLILPKANSVPEIITGGQNTVGLRLPGHPVALALLKVFGSGIAAPSANRFGSISPTLPAHVSQELGEQVAMILEGGPCEVGIESTIVDLSADGPRILRPGMITAAQIMEITGPLATGSEITTRVSGALTSHYAPQTPMQIIPKDKMGEVLAALVNRKRSSVVLAINPLDSPGIQWLLMPSNPEAYAHELYAKMRLADQAKQDVILVEDVPAEETWSAIRDRLRKAAG